MTENLVKTQSISVVHEQIRAKALILYDQYKADCGIIVPEGIVDDQVMILEEILFYCCEHNRPEDLREGDSALNNRLAEEIYLVSFCFWGNTEEPIIPFSFLSQFVKDAYIKMVVSIHRWWQAEEIPKNVKRAQTESQKSESTSEK